MMCKKLLLLIYISFVELVAPLSVMAFATKSDGEIITEREMFINAVNHYNNSIKKQENIKSAIEAEKRGKNFFKEGRLDQAYFHGYGDAIAWIPRPEYFFIVGDLKMRMKLSLHSDSKYATPEYKACWDKYLFAIDVSRSIESSFEKGFGLVQELNLSETKKSKIYSQAMASASCFSRLTSKYSEGVGPQCVPIEEVKTCLGSPLLLLYH